MTLSEIHAATIAPALALLPAKMSGPAAEALLLAIGLQESGFTTRHQLGGPAHGYWQFERGGVSGVLTHPASRVQARAVCEACGIKPTVEAVYAALEHDDILAAAFARLLFWIDPSPLPAVGDAGRAWDLYLRTWRPGRPRRDSWDALYARAVGEVSP
jgi:hypothetical protein